MIIKRGILKNMMNIRGCVIIEVGEGIIIIRDG